MQEMYNAKLGSPITTLAEDISPTQTTITVADASFLGAAPNIATITTGVNSETVKYTGITLNTLTGVTRGFQGSVQAWANGTNIARIITAYDHDTFLANINEVDGDLATHKADGVHQSLVIPVLESDPISPVEGQMWILSNQTPTLSNLLVQNPTATGFDIQGDIFDAEGDDITEIEIQYQVAGGNWSTPVSIVLSSTQDITNFTNDWYSVTGQTLIEDEDYDYRVRAKDSGYGEWETSTIAESGGFTIPVVILLTESVEIDSLSIYNAFGWGADLTGQYKMSTTFKPTTNVSISKIEKVFSTRASSLHDTGNDIRCRICPDNGSGKPNESIVFSTTTITGCPSAADTLFIGVATFATSANNFSGKVDLTANTRYHLVFDVPSGTGKSRYSDHIQTNSSAVDPLGGLTYNNGWGALSEVDNPAVKIYKVT